MCSPFYVYKLTFVSLFHNPLNYNLSCDGMWRSFILKIPELFLDDLFFPVFIHLSLIYLQNEYMKEDFCITIETWHKPDLGTQENVNVSLHVLQRLLFVVLNSWCLPLFRSIN